MWTDYFNYTKRRDKGQFIGDVECNNPNSLQTKKRGVKESQNEPQERA